jgi:predicted nuclease of restriction endonuclease-like RecB superfamily
MAFRQEDFKKTSRKGSTGVPASLYPHQLKDKKAVARLEIAIRTFDAAVGKRRRDMDAQAMTDFFGDPRLARGIVACLGQFYRYETPGFAQMVGQDGAARLTAAGLSNPIDVRADTYAFVNEYHHGFLTEASLATCYERLGERFSLTAHQWDTLMHLDAEENQILTRLGAMPTPANIIALYNFHSLDTVLRRASSITLLGLTLAAGDASEIRALAKALGVRAVVSEGNGSVALSESETVSILPRRAGRLSRCLLYLVQTYATSAITGYADAKIGAKSFRLMLGVDTLRALGMPTKRTVEEKPDFKRRFEAGLALHKDLLKKRSKGEVGSWRIKRLPEPCVSPLGILLPDFTLTSNGRLAHVLLGAEANGEWDAPVLNLTLGRKPLDAAALLTQAEAATSSLFALPPVRPPAVPSDVRALCDKAAREGLVRSADARRALHLLEDSPLIEWVRQAADPRVRYVPGVGLCSQEMVAAIQGEE